VADPLLGVAQVVVPTIVDALPISEPLIVWTLAATLKTGHALNALGTGVGVLSDNDNVDYAAEDAAQDLKETWYEHVSLVKFAIGFGISIFIDLLTLFLGTEKLSRWIETINNVNLYLVQSGISQELRTEAPDWIPNWILLSRVQALERKNQPIMSNSTSSREQLEDGQQ
jgi:hypothetical protein